jgi:hypothetical protein
MLDFERWWDFGVIPWKTDFFRGFAASDFKGCFLEGVGFAAGERGVPWLVVNRILSIWSLGDTHRKSSGVCLLAW